MAKKVFQPIGDYEEIYNLKELKNNIVSGSRLTNVKVDASEIIKTLNDKVNSFEKKYEEIIDYISQFWGKFIHVKFLYKINDGDSIVWKTYYEANVMPYYYQSDNNYLFGLFCKLNDCYQGGIVDKSINLFNLVQNDILEIEEISEEEFLGTAHKTLFECVKSRYDKIENGDYVLTKNGYKYK